MGFLLSLLAVVHQVCGAFKSICLTFSNVAYAIFIKKCACRGVTGCRFLLSNADFNLYQAYLLYLDQFLSVIHRGFRLWFSNLALIQFVMPARSPVYNAMHSFFRTIIHSLAMLCCSLTLPLS